MPVMEPDYQTLIEGAAQQLKNRVAHLVDLEGQGRILSRFDLADARPILGELVNGVRQIERAGRPPTREEELVLTLLAKILTGLQVPLSIGEGLLLGAAVPPLRELRRLMAAIQGEHRVWGWHTEDEAFRALAFYLGRRPRVAAP